MSAQGSIIARVYTSDAYLPLPGAPVTYTQQDDTGGQVLLAIRYTNSSGLTAPLYLDTPDAAQSQFPGGIAQPYAAVNLSVSFPGYSSLFVSDVQIFPGIETIQGLQLTPVTATQRASADSLQGGSQRL